MKLIKDIKVHGSSMEFTFEHKVKGVKKEIVTTAINLQNAQRKAFVQLNQMYRDINGKSSKTKVKPVVSNPISTRF